MLQARASLIALRADADDDDSDGVPLLEPTRLRVSLESHYWRGVRAACSFVEVEAPHPALRLPIDRAPQLWALCGAIGGAFDADDDAAAAAAAVAARAAAVELGG